MYLSSCRAKYRVLKTDCYRLKRGLRGVSQDAGTQTLNEKNLNVEACTAGKTCFSSFPKSVINLLRTSRWSASTLSRMIYKKTKTKLQWVNKYGFYRKSKCINTLECHTHDQIRVLANSTRCRTIHFWDFCANFCLRNVFQTLLVLSCKCRW